MLTFASGQHSPFLLQAIFASGAQYAPLELLSKCGFKDREEAQRTFIERAALLYDLNAEQSQLRLLQGSVVLGGTVSSSSYTRDKDFRYWLCNAVRIATRMGLHRK